MGRVLLAGGSGLVGQALLQQLSTDPDVTEQAPEPPVEALERDEDGALKVSLSASPTIGTQRWLLVFPETPWPVDWSLPRAIRWEQLMARISTGAVPLFTFELEVSAP